MAEEDSDHLKALMADPGAALSALEQIEAEDSLLGFIRMFWSVLEPSRKFIEGWALTAICEHLEAVSSGQIKRLLINVPPGPGWVENQTVTRRGRMRVGDLVVGDEVLTHLGRFRRVTAVHDRGLMNTVKIGTALGRSVVSTPDHLFFTAGFIHQDTPRPVAGGWTPAGQLLPGRRLVAVSLDEPSQTEDSVISILPNGLAECRCITVEEDESWTWNDIAVHNCMKSLTTNVFWPAWEWGPRNRPSLSYLSSSYSEALTLRDNRRCRNIILSELYQKIWGNRVKISADQNAKGRFDNMATGFKIATSVAGLGTGERADRIILDDLHSIKESESEARREAVIQFFTEVIPSRTRDNNSAIIVIMQRVHERDVSGQIISSEIGYDHLCLPMRYETNHPYVSKTKLHFVDPRTVDGELLWPERFPEDVVQQDLEKPLSAWGGEYAVCSQLQQRPAPRGGGMFKKKDFVIVESGPMGSGVRRVRGWDLAASLRRQAAFTAGVRMAISPDGRTYIEDVRRKRLSPHEVEMTLLQTAQHDGAGVAIDLPQDPGQAGLAQKMALVRLLAGFNVRFSVESGAKEDRARPFAAQAEAGNVYLVRAPWNETFINEAMTFPMGAYKDQVDAATRAYAALLRSKQRVLNFSGPTVMRETF